MDKSSRLKHRRVRLVTCLVLALAVVSIFQLLMMRSSTSTISGVDRGAAGLIAGNAAGGRAVARPLSDRWADYLKNVVNKVVNKINLTEWSELVPPEELRLATQYQTFTPEELESKFHSIDLVYTWVNGSELNHMFRKYWRRRDPVYASKPGWDDQRWYPKETVGAVDWQLENVTEITRFLAERRTAVVTSRDRESDELRFSFRSLQQYAPWHTGRIIVVAPGHTPEWLDHSHNFFARSDNPQNSHGSQARRRVICVHQDSVLPGDQRLTWNSNTIEQHIHKLRHLSPLFVQFNDDYFINKNTTAGHFVSAFGGPVLLHEQGELRGGLKAYQNMRKIWLGGVYHSNAFNINELEVVPPKYLPQYIMDDIAKVDAAMEQQGGEVGGTGRKLQEFNLSLLGLRGGGGAGAGNLRLLGGRQENKLRDELMKVHQERLARNNAADPGDNMVDAPAKRKRYFLKHAPFVYCRNMFRHFATRYYRQLRPPAQRNPHRNKEDFLMPFLHNGFIIDRPWAGSVNYLPHLRDLNVVADPQTVPKRAIALNNEDGCAPALNKIGDAAQSLLVIFINDEKENEKRVENLRVIDPVFFALNDGFSVESVSLQLKRFMLTKYPEPSPFEHEFTAHPNPVASSREDITFSGLMHLPLLVLITEQMTMCPMVRSLQLALPDFEGPIVFLLAKQARPPPILLDQETMSEDGPRLVTRCKSDERKVFTVVLPEDESNLEPLKVAHHADSIVGKNTTPVQIPSDAKNEAVARLVIDLRRTSLSPLRIPGQTLAWEDFDASPNGLVHSVAILRNDAINWIVGSSEKHLLHTYPLPYTRYEDSSELLFQANPNAG